MMGAALAGRLTLIDLLLLLGVLVVVPLGMRLVPLQGRLALRVLCVARLAQPVGALAVVVAFILPAGWIAGSIALGWLIVCGVAALAGVLELVETRTPRAAHLAPAAALVYLGIGAAWLVASRLGLRPMGFSPAIVELTGVHFHYAGFAATLMGALTLEALSGRPGRLALAAEAAALLLVAGTPLTAAGIATSSALFTIAGPIVLAAGVLTTAALSAVAVAPGIGHRGSRWLLRLSSAAVVVPMLLGVDYALSRVFPTLPALDIPTMALVHGDLNAVAFSLMGILGWTLALRGAGRLEHEVAMIHLETVIAAPPERCFDLARDVDLHQRSTAASGERAVAGVTAGLLGPGEQVTWAARHLGMERRLTSRITEFDRPRRFVDEMVDGPFESVRHLHTFEPVDAGTRMIDVFEYRTPFGAIGRIADALFLRRYMTRLLLGRNAYLKRMAEETV